MSKPDSGPRRCPNCHAVASHNFCPNCGQPTTSWRAGIADVVHEFTSATVGADARIWVSLRELFRRPGSLTVAYFEGRRFRYLSPLRLYLFASVFMFMVWAVMPNHGGIISIDAPSLGIGQAADGETTGFEAFFEEQLPGEGT